MSSGRKTARRRPPNHDGQATQAPRLRPRAHPGGPSGAGEIRCLLDGPEFARVNSVAGLDAWAKKIGEAATAPVPETVSPLIAHLRGVDRRDALIHAGEDLYQAAREASAPTSPEREAGSWERLEYALADWRLVVDGGGKP